MMRSDYVIVNKNALPGVYRQVLLAKELIASGEAPSVTRAAKMAGISRSAYYKYKDFVFTYSAAGEDGIITVKLKLKDNKGVLSAVVNEIYKAGANVLAINQSVPNNSVADVTLTLYTADMSISGAELAAKLKALDGVRLSAGKKQSANHMDINK